MAFIKPWAKISIEFYCCLLTDKLLTQTALRLASRYVDIHESPV